jgi:hypothetical protein
MMISSVTPSRFSDAMGDTTNCLAAARQQNTDETDEDNGDKRIDDDS